MTAATSTYNTPPFVTQADSAGYRTCGAACLSMVYSALGKPVSGSAIWPKICKQNKAGILSSTTHLMVSHALSCGFAAVAVQARSPIQILRACLDSGIYAILNHRCQNGDSAGHYTTLVDMDDQNVILHDPFVGPARRVPHADLLNLWQPLSYGSEIAGNVIVCVSAVSQDPANCNLCKAAIPSDAECPECGTLVPLRPAAPLGCIDSRCLGRLWSFLCCPKCDHMWTFDVSERQRAQGPGLHPQGIELPTRSAESIDLTPLFAAFDKFCDHIREIPGAETHTRIRQQLDFIRASKEKLKQAQVEMGAFHAMRRQQSETKLQEAQRRLELHKQKMKDLGTPGPPLDANELGRALLQELGFTS